MFIFIGSKPNPNKLHPNLHINQRFYNNVTTLYCTLRLTVFAVVAQQPARELAWPQGGGPLGLVLAAARRTRHCPRQGLFHARGQGSI